MKIINVIISALFLAWISNCANAAPQIAFNANGLSSIQTNGAEILANGQPELRQRMIWPGEAPNGPNPHVSFDHPAQILRQEFTWGTIFFTYQTANDRLNLDLRIVDTSKAGTRLLDLAVMRLKLPGDVKITDRASGWPSPVNPADEPAIAIANYPGGSIAFCCDDVAQPVEAHIQPAGNGEYTLELKYPGPPWGSIIGGGDWREIHLSLRFGNEGAKPAELAADLYKKFAQKFPREVSWNDHRPIGSLNLAQSENTCPKNPRGWFGDKYTLDVTTPKGIENFHTRLLKLADDCVHFAKDMNAQGIIVWDIEGQEMPHMISYIGDPRLMPVMAPEMDSVADQFMKKFTDAGLRIGVTIRPSHVVRTPGGKHPWEHIAPADAVEEISQKIEYAKKRWGCTLFYIDSTVMWDVDAHGKLDLKTMPAEYFEILHQRFPDSLLIPEESTTRAWAYAAPYHELQQGYSSTPASVRACWPEAFSVLRVVDAGIPLVRQHHDELVAGVRAGDILFYRTWFDDEYDREVKQIYRDAAGSATRYYVSPHGDDHNDGRTQATPWHTAAHVNASNFHPGDQILFQRGGNWHEQLIATSDGQPNNPITYGDYGNPNDPKPTFWGSDVIPPSAFTPGDDDTFTVPLSALPEHRAFYLFANHQFLSAVHSAAHISRGSFFIGPSSILFKTRGDDPRTGEITYTASDRAQGVNADSSLICSNGHNHLLFINLIGRETAADPTKDGVPDAYVFRIQGSSNIRLQNCEAYDGGKHHFGVINSTGFVGNHLYAAGCLPGLNYGNAGALVSFSDESRHGDSSQWIDCTVDHFDPGQQSFITHGPGIGYLLIENLHSLGCSIAIGTDAPGEKVLIHGGLLTGPTCDIYGTGVHIDALKITGDAKIDLFGNHNLVENCMDDQSTNPQGSIIVRGQDNIIRNNKLDHHPNGPGCIDVKASARNTQLVDNSFSQS